MVGFANPITHVYFLWFTYNYLMLYLPYRKVHKFSHCQFWSSTSQEGGTEILVLLVHLTSVDGTLAVTCKSGSGPSMVTTSWFGSISPSLAMLKRVELPLVPVQHTSCCQNLIWSWWWQLINSLPCLLMCNPYTLFRRQGCKFSKSIQWVSVIFLLFSHYLLLFFHSGTVGCSWVRANGTN